ncbi:hypothetical protein OROHE_016863 [Orobanche hederae]
MRREEKTLLKEKRREVGREEHTQKILFAIFGFAVEILIRRIIRMGEYMYKKYLGDDVEVKKPSMLLTFNISTTIPAVHTVFDPIALVPAGPGLVPAGPGLVPATLIVHVWVPTAAAPAGPGLDCSCLGSDCCCPDCCCSGPDCSGPDTSIFSS